MKGRKDTTRLRIRFAGISAIILCIIILSAMSLRAEMVSADAGPPPQISFNVMYTAVKINDTIGTDFADLSINDTFTIVAFLTNFLDLYTYQAVFKYNGTVVNMTDIRYPSNNVFSGHDYITVSPPTDVEAAGDAVDFLNYTVVGATLYGDNEYADVLNGTLFEADFTVVGDGQTIISLCTKNNPALTGASSAGTNAWYTYCLTPEAVENPGLEYTDFTTRGFSVGRRPIASFTLFSLTPDNTTYLLLYKMPAPGVVNYVSCFEGVPVYFNASDSYFPGGNVTTYIWNFGDGNTTMVNNGFTGNLTAYIAIFGLANATVVNATSAATAPLISHAYGHIGTYTVSLVVLGNGTINKPPPRSRPYTYTVLVGLSLQYYDWSWFIYTFAALIGACIVIAATTSAVRRVRRRRALKKQKMLVAAPSGRPPTGAKTS